MKSVIYDQSLRYIKVLMWILALWVFLRGHNAPGGGFAAALIASLAIITAFPDCILWLPRLMGYKG